MRGSWSSDVCRWVEVVKRNVVHCSIWYHLYNLKNVKNIHGGVLLLVKLQASACNFTKSNTPLWVFFTFFKLYEWYQIAQRTTYNYTFLYKDSSGKHIFLSNLFVCVRTSKVAISNIKKCVRHYCHRNRLYRQNFYYHSRSN